MDKVLMWLLNNANTAGIVVYLILTMVFGGYAVHKGWIVPGKVYDTLQKAYDTLVPAMDAVEEKLTEQRIFNERATVTLEHMTAENQRQARQIERLEHELQLERTRSARGGK